MRFLVMGAGALGGYFGGRLQGAGHDVTFVARGAQLEAMRQSGLRIESGAGDLTLDEVRAVADPAEAGPADVVLFMVKNYDLREAAEALAPVMGDETVVLTVQNGVTAPERLSRILGSDHVVPGVVRLPADVSAPGVIRHPVAFHKFLIGERSGEVTPRIRAIAEAIEGSGPECEITGDIEGALWRKMIMLSSMSAMTALTRLDIGPIRECPQSRDLLVACVNEAAAVGRVVCPSLTASDVTEAQTFLLETIDGHVHASMLDDLTRGKRLELNFLSGEIVRLGGRHGVPTPTHAFVTAALQPFVEGAVDHHPAG